MIVRFGSLKEWKYGGEMKRANLIITRMLLLN